jgi:hypothetical protein
MKRMNETCERPNRIPMRWYRFLINLFQNGLMIPKKSGKRFFSTDFSAGHSKPKGQKISKT